MRAHKSHGTFIRTEGAKSRPFHEVFARCAHNCGLAIKQVASLLGTPLPTMHAYFNGTRPMPVETLIAYIDETGDLSPVEWIAERTRTQSRVRTTSGSQT